MSKVIVVFGFGPGISAAVAEKFGAEGYAVALVARSAERIESAAKALSAKGVSARAIVGDASDAGAVAAAIAEARKLGPIAAIHWNAYSGKAGDVLTASVDELKSMFDVPVFGLVAAVKASLADLEAQKGAVLVTGGGFAFYEPAIDAMAVQFQSMGLAIGKAAQHKAVGLLSAHLAPKGVYVGEVVVLGMVKGTAFDHGNATLDANDIAQRFWEIAAERKQTTVTFG